VGGGVGFAGGGPGAPPPPPPPPTPQPPIPNPQYLKFTKTYLIYFIIQKYIKLFIILK